MKQQELKAAAQAQGLNYGQSRGVVTDNVGNILQGLFEQRVARLLCEQGSGYLEGGIEEKEDGSYLVIVEASNSLRRKFLQEELESLKATMTEGLLSFCTSLLSAFSYLSREIEASEVLRDEEMKGIYSTLK